MQASPLAPSLDEDLRPAGLDGLGGLDGLAGLNGLAGPPHEPVFPDDLNSATFAGFLLASPLVAEITRVAAAVVATLLATPPARAAVVPANGQICTLFAVDIAGFTRPERDDDIRLYLREKLYEFLEKAFDDSGVPWAACCREDRGDGALVVIPPDIPGKGVIDPLPERLRTLVRRHNHVSSAAARLQLRLAAHIGPVDHDGHGFVGTDVNLLFRMLEARPLKRALAESAAELALVVSDYVYGSLVCRYPTLVSPEAFRAARFQVKQTRAKAWTYLPGAAVTRAG